MLAFLEGTIAFKGIDAVHLNVNGIGFSLLMSGRSIAQLPQAGDTALIYCHLAVSENAVALYGFVSEEERALFDSLTNVSGIGPKTALSALSAFEPQELVAAIASQDVKAVSRIPGVGKKSASRIILELKDKFESFGSADELIAIQASDSSASGLVVTALRDFGFNDAEISSALEGSDPNADESEMLQYALKRLGR